MRTGWTTLAAAGALFAGAAATGQTAPPRTPAGDIIAGRQAAYLMSAATFGGMKRVIDAGGDVKGLAFPARALARWAKAIPGMFPAGSDGAPSGALPTVWSDRTGFEAKAQAYADAADKLAVFATAGDAAAVATQWAVVGGTCKACHDGYRKPEERRPG